MDKAWIVRGDHNERRDEAAKEFRKRMPAAETVLWSHLRRNKLRGLHFRRQQVIDGYIADFYCHTVGLVVEVDGSAHDAHAAEDRERDQAIGLRGLRVIRFSNDRILYHLPDCLAEIHVVARGVEKQQ